MSDVGKSDTEILSSLGMGRQFLHRKTTYKHMDRVERIVIDCPKCGSQIIDNRRGRFPCSFCGRLNESPEA